MKYFFIIDKKILIIIFLVLTITSYSYYLDHLSIPGNTSTMIFKVAIDPGHGGIDTGTNYNSIYEKNINLDIAKYLNESLKESNIIAIMTREKDILYKKSRAKDLKYRPEFANEKEVDLFVSIHVNHFPSANAKGSQIFYKQSSKKSKKLAKDIQSKLIELDSANNREIKTGNYYVLNQVNCPAVLIECGFLSNETDRNNLTDRNYQKIFAGKIKEGIINYLQKDLENIKYEDYEVHNYKKTIYGLKFNQNKTFSIYHINKEDNNLNLVQSDFIYPTGSFLNQNLKKLNQIEFTALSALEQLTNYDKNKYFPLSDKMNIQNINEENGIVYIDISSEITKKFQGGAPLEEKTVIAIYKTLYSISGIKKVILTIDGEQNSTIGGHIILP